MKATYLINGDTHQEIIQGETVSLALEIRGLDGSPIDFTDATEVRLDLPAEIGTMARGSLYLQVLAVDTDKEELVIPGHGLVKNDIINMTTSDTLPAGLAESTDYYVSVVDADHIKLSESLNGAAVDLTSDGAGTQTVIFHPLDITTPAQGLLTVSLLASATSALKVGEKQAMELQWTIDGVIHILQMPKSLTVLAQVL